MMDKWQCKNCGDMSRGMNGIELVIDPNPLPETEAEEWPVCKSCRTVEGFYPICDEFGCKNQVSCGTPTPDGYRNTCSKHKPPALLESR